MPPSALDAPASWLAWRIPFSLPSGVTVLEIIQRSAEFLTRKGVESPRLQVELLLAHLLQMPRMKLYLNFDRVVTEAEQGTLREWVKRRGEREPLQHIVGTAPFCGMEFTVNREVLVPRPETELLVEEALRLLGARSESEGAATVLDFGTGSGCIAISVASRAAAGTVVHAVDVSPAALEVARANALRLGVGERVLFHNGDGLAVLEPGLRFDLVLSNPPYIPAAEIATLDPEVRDFDPRLALDGGADGLDFYRRLADQARARMKRGGRMVLEFGDGQHGDISALLVAAGWTVETLCKDFAGKERIVIARAGDW